LEHRESGEFKILCQHIVEFNFEIRTGVELTGVERFRDTNFEVSTGGPALEYLNLEPRIRILAPLCTFYFAVPTIPPLFPLICASRQTFPR
jgi:hypothetical protein